MTEIQREGGTEFFHRRIPPGSPPGMLEADPEAPKPVIRVIAYSQDEMVEEEVTDLGTIAELRGKWPNVWLNVDGLGDAQIIARLGEAFGVHRLALEDVIHVHQRAKVENYGDYLFMVARMATYEEELETEQISLVLGQGFVLTFQETVGDCLDPVRERIRTPGTKVRLQKPDYLAYAILDAVIDNYFPIIERYGDRLEDLEDAAMARPSARTLSSIHSAKRDLRVIRRAIWPHRDALNALLREPASMIMADTRIYLRDTLDHVTQIIDLVEVQRELGADLVELYMTNVSNRMNEVMKVLTMIATIFIPLSFVAGMYGMNFDRSSPLNMPELGWRYGYVTCLAVMAAIAGGLTVYFFRKGWIGFPSGPGPEDR